MSTFPENFMQIRSGGFAQKLLTDGQTKKNDDYKHILLRGGNDQSVQQNLKGFQL